MTRQDDFTKRAEKAVKRNNEKKKGDKASGKDQKDSGGTKK